MAEVMMALAFGKMALGLAQTAQASAAASAQAKSNAAALRYEADAMDQHAGQQRAISQVKAEEEMRKSKLMQSRQLAASAASGAGTGGSAGDNMARTAAKGDYNAALALWQGETDARGTEQGAAMKRYGADLTMAQEKARRRSMPFQYASTVVSGVADIYSAGASGGYFARGGDPWTQTVRGPDDNVRLTEDIPMRRGTYY